MTHWLQRPPAREGDGETVPEEDRNAFDAPRTGPVAGPSLTLARVELAETPKAEPEDDETVPGLETEREGEENGELDLERIARELAKIGPESGQASVGTGGASGHQFEAFTIGSIGEGIGHLDGLGPETGDEADDTPDLTTSTLPVLSLLGAAGGAASLSALALIFNDDPGASPDFGDPTPGVNYVFGPGTANPPTLIGATDTLGSPPLPGTGTADVTYTDIASATVDLTTGWGSTRNLMAESDGAANVTIKNFLHVEVALGDTDLGGGPLGSSVTLAKGGGRGVKRGSVSTGNGDDVIDITAYSDGAGVGDPALMTVTSNGGNDTITFTGTNSGAKDNEIEIDAGAGDDTVTLGEYYVAGTIEGGAGDDVLRGGTADDVIKGEDDDDILSGGKGDDVLNGGAGTDTADYSGAANKVTADLSAGAAVVDGDGGSDTLTGIENLIGSDKNDTLTGDNGANRIEGGKGNDVIDGKGGNDTLLGGDGNDVIDGGAGTDTIDAGAGNDRIEISGAEAEHDSMVGGAGTDRVENVGGTDVTLDGFDSTTNSIERFDADGHDIQGNSGANTLDFSLTQLIDVIDIRGEGGNDDITGSTGKDSIYGGSDADTIDGNAGNDDLYGDGGNDDISGGAGKDTIEGGSGNDTISGGDQNDTIDGGSGSDTIAGDKGKDIITTGAGSDVIDFNSGDLGAGVDQVTDFTTGVGGDVLDIGDLLVGYTPGVSDINDFVSLSESGGNTTVKIDPNGTTGGASFTSLVRLDGLTGLDVDTLLGDGNIDPVV